MTKSFTIGFKLMSAMIAMSALTVALGWLGLSTISRMDETFRVTAQRTMRRLVLADAVFAEQNMMISAQRGIVLSSYAKDPGEIETYRQDFRENSALIGKNLEEIMRLAILPETRSLVRDTQAKLAEWQPHFEDLLREATSGNSDEANRIRKTITTPVYKAIGANSSRVAAIQSEILATDEQNLTESSAQARFYSIALMTFCLFACAVGIFMVRGVNTALRGAVAQLLTGAEQVTSAAEQVSSSSQSLAQGSSQQAASLQETNSSSQEINASAQRNTASSASAAELVANSQRKFTDANAMLDQMLAAMSEINSSSEKISRIIRVIDEIAFQTNILALNAAVEAARAGEAGMGFAVVADEVRNLAQRCATAARDTAGLIEGSITASQEGTIRMNGVASAIRDIAVQTASVQKLVDSVNHGSSEQADGVAVIARALAQIEQVTQRTAANAEEGAAAAEELNAQSQGLKNILRRLQVMVDGPAADTYQDRIPRHNQTSQRQIKTFAR